MATTDSLQDTLNKMKSAKTASVSQDQTALGLLSDVDFQGATKASVSQGQTSAGLLNSMLKSDSPLMKQAATQGRQQAARRGLLNSSMAAGASQGAMIQNAQPFALQDAQTYANLAQFNTGQENQMRSQQNQIMGQGALQDSGNYFDQAQFNANAENQMRSQANSLLGESYLSDQSYQQQQGLNDQQFGYQTQLSDQSYQQQQGLNDQQFGYQTQLSDQSYQQQQGLNDQQFGYQTQLSDQSYQQQQGLNDQQAQLQSQRDEQLASYDKDMQRLNAELQEAQAANDFERTQQITDQQAGIQRERDQVLFNQQLESTAQEYGLRGDLLKQETEQEMKKLYGSSMANAWGVMGNNVTDIVAQSMDAINNIQSNSNIAAADKTKMIEQVMSMRDSDIQFQQSLYQSLPNYLADTGVFPTA
ncbi:hypothetical protein [Halomonas shantousis]